MPVDLRVEPFSARPHRCYCFLEPSVAQPPFPLQEFLPSQACLSFLSALEVVESFPASEDAVGLELSDVGAAFKRAIVPPNKPVKAAVRASECLRIFMCIYLLV